MTRILLFNWRDIKNPAAGGAEVFTHEVMSRLIKKGHDVTMFTSSFPNSLHEEIIDGIKIIRDGGKYMVYEKARKFCKKFQNNFDLIIDEKHTKPFLTPKFVNGKPILAIMHGVCKELWDYGMPFPLNYIGKYYFEKKWLSYYTDVKVITVSNSSKEELKSFADFKDISIVPEGISVKPLAKSEQKESIPTIAFIGRLKKTKLPDHAIKAFPIIKKEIPNVRMWVIGDGEMRQRLEKMAADGVKFFGRVDNEIKNKLLSKSHLVLVPSLREGWGLVVTESNAMGTPAVAYDVAGLRDSVKHEKTGLLVSENSPEGLAESAITLLKDPKRLSQMSEYALDYSRQFSWDNTAAKFDEIIRKMVN